MLVDGSGLEFTISFLWPRGDNQRVEIKIGLEVKKELFYASAYSSVCHASGSSQDILESGTPYSECWFQEDEQGG